jgi:hypothetical protein
MSGRKRDEEFAARVEELREQGKGIQEIADTLALEGYGDTYIENRLGVRPTVSSTGRIRTAQPHIESYAAIMAEVATQVKDESLKRIADVLRVGHHVLDRYEHRAQLQGKGVLEFINDAVDFWNAYHGLVELLLEENRALRYRVEELEDTLAMLNEELKGYQIKLSRVGLRAIERIQD